MVYRVLSREELRLSDWVTLVTKTVKGPAVSGEQVYHSLKLQDYITIIPITIDKKILIVEQYRPALNEETLEFPGGLLENGETAENAVRRELIEETGYQVSGKINKLGVFATDTGRLENRLHGFFADVKKIKGSLSEQGIKVHAFTASEILNLVSSGRFNHALHISLLGLYLLRLKK